MDHPLRLPRLRPSPFLSNALDCSSPAASSAADKILLSVSGRNPLSAVLLALAHALRGRAAVAALALLDLLSLDPSIAHHDVALAVFEVRDPRATHNCWAYKLGDQYRSNDDGEPSGTAGKPIYSTIESSGLDRVMLVVIRHFGGIKLGTGGLVRAYGGVASECLKGAATCLVKPKARIGMEVPFELLGAVYHQTLDEIPLEAESIEKGYTLDANESGLHGLPSSFYAGNNDLISPYTASPKNPRSRKSHHSGEQPSAM